MIQVTRWSGPLEASDWIYNLLNIPAGNIERSQILCFVNTNTPICAESNTIRFNFGKSGSILQNVSL